MFYDLYSVVSIGTRDNICESSLKLCYINVHYVLLWGSFSSRVLNRLERTWREEKRQPAHYGNFALFSAGRLWGEWYIHYWNIRKKHFHFLPYLKFWFEFFKHNGQKNMMLIDLSDWFEGMGTSGRMKS